MDTLQIDKSMLKAVLARITYASRHCVHLSAEQRKGIESGAKSDADEIWNLLTGKTNGLTKDQVHVLRHALTASTETEPYRNYFAATEDNLYRAVLEDMVDMGYMRRGKRVTPSKDGGRCFDYYHCTEKGAEAVGLKIPVDPGHNGG